MATPNNMQKIDEQTFIIGNASKKLISEEESKLWGIPPRAITIFQDCTTKEPSIILLYLPKVQGNAMIKCVILK